MAADVGCLVRIMSEYKKESDDKRNHDLVTRDFLGCAAVVGAKELDLDLKVPCGFERHLDLSSGETYLERKGSRSRSMNRQMHDLNFPPPSQMDNSALDLKLLLSSPSPPRSNYQSVCTLEKVRSALERAGRETQSKIQKRPEGSASSPTSSATSSSARKRGGDHDAEAEAEAETDGSDSSACMVAAGCPSCLSYVLISKRNPRCPRCEAHVTPQPPAAAKKLRIDLNLL